MDRQHPCLFIQTTTNVHHDHTTRCHRVEHLLLYHTTTIVHTLYRTRLYDTRRCTRIRYDHTFGTKHDHYHHVYLYRTTQKRRNIKDVFKMNST